MSVNSGPFDRFSIVHAGFGVWAGARGFGFLPTLALHTVWEIIEAVVHERYSRDHFTFQPEPMMNRIGDTVSCMAGWALNLPDRLKDDPWIGQVNPVRLVWGAPTGIPTSTAGNLGVLKFAPLQPKSLRSK